MAVPQAPVENKTPPSADDVSKAFVHQYYYFLHQSPELVHRFYQEISKLGRADGISIMGVTTTTEAINAKILSLDYGEFRAEISTVDAQDSYNGGFLVLVTGYLTGKDNLKRKFIQSFFLAPQSEGGYFVLNDMCRFVQEPQMADVNVVSSVDVEAPLAINQDPATSQENDITGQDVEPVEAEDHAEVYNPPENGNVSAVEEQVVAPEAEVIDEVPFNSDLAAESDAKHDDVPKKSYASIVRVVKEGSVPVSASPPVPMKSALKAQEKPVAATPTPVPAVETQVPNSKATENGNSQESEFKGSSESADGHSIYLKGLPENVTYLLIERECSKFGRIKNNGIQIRGNWGFNFGFVEFEERSAAQSAIKASPVTICGQKVVVEPKKSAGRASTRERFSTGRPSVGFQNDVAFQNDVGFQNDVPRGPGNYGGNRGYRRAEMNNQPEFGNRNSSRRGYSQRGNGGYNRAERPRRGLNGGDPVKNMAPQVPATAGGDW